ncbi:MAG: hypothetical protein IJN82_07570 [Clostridia bacterium]|nr:hypothetical protein [Clostridia bacterium]
MSRLFEITLDELVYASPAEVPPKAAAERVGRSVRTSICLMMLFFGMIFFLLSIFWGDHLRFGEEFGELVSLIIILFGTALLATDNTQVLACTALLYFAYSTLCFGILDVADLLNSIFIFVAGMVILVWFIVWGLHATAEPKGETA